MHIIKKSQTSVTLFSRDGGVWRYASKKAAREQLGLSWISSNVGQEFREYSHSVWRNTEGHRLYSKDFGDEDGEIVFVERYYRQSQFVMRDEHGKPLTVTDFYATSTGRPWYGYNGRLKDWNGEGPVPGIHRNRPSRHRGRQLNYMNALRGAQTFYEEGEVPPRPERQKSLKADRWDIYPSSARTDRNWKRFRKTQWKAKAGD